MNFYTVIFLDCDKSMSEDLKAKLSVDQNIRAFHVTIADELEQIMLQAYKTFVIIDRMNSLSDLFQVTTRKQKIKLLTTCYDHMMLLSESEVNYLKSKNIRVTRANKEQDLISKIEFYFFGRINVLGKSTFEKDDVQVKKNAYFTLLKNFNNKFKVIASSHFREEKINQIIGKDFEELIETLIESPNSFKEKKERTIEGSEYVEFLYPVVIDKYLDSIGVVHLKKNDDFDQKKEKLQAFIYNLAKG